MTRSARDIERLDLGKAITLCGLIALSATAPANAANLIVNGDFATGAPASGCSAGLVNGSLPGWTITNNVDIDSALQPFDPPAGCSGISPPVGTYFIDLTGSGAEGGVNDRGSISQTVSTQVGQTYDLSFYFGGNPQWQYLRYPNDGPVKAMDVLLNNDAYGTYSVNTAGAAVTNGQFTAENLYFTATSSSTTIGFESLNGVGITAPSDFGPLVADVILAPVPLPGTLWLLMAAFGGLAIVGYKNRSSYQDQPGAF